MAEVSDRARSDWSVAGPFRLRGPFGALLSEAVPWTRRALVPARYGRGIGRKSVRPSGSSILRSGFLP